MHSPFDIERGFITPGDLPLTAVEEEAADLPERYALLQNYPNPFNPETRITYLLPRREEVVIQVYTLTGQRIRTLEDGVAAAGRHVAVWDGRDEAGRAVGSGVYLVRLQASEFVGTRRMTLLR
jgi:type IV secretory pathway protease TraF